jgi:gliding motility-associated-like protein
MHHRSGFTPQGMRIFRRRRLFQKGASYIAVVIFMTVLLIQKNGFSQAPPIEWQKTFGGTSYDEAEKIIQTSDGGYIMAGWSYSNDGDATGNHAPGNGDCWIIKMDPTGNVQWKKMIGGTDYEDALTIKETRDGGYIIGGHTSSKDGDLTGNYADSYDALVIKLDQSGNIEWLKNLGGADYDAILSIDTTRDGGYILAGYTGSNNMDVSGNHGDYDAWIVKLDNTGNIQWQRCIGGTDRDNAWSITSSPDGGYVFAGHTTSTDGDIVFNHGQWDIMVGKLDAAGNTQWIKTMGGSLTEWSLGIVPASDGGYVIAGYAFSGNGDVSTNYGLNDVWIIKINEQGNLQWEKSYGGTDFEDPYYIAPTSDGGYVVAGRTRSGNGDVSVNYGNNDYWILKLDVNGDLQWEKSLGGTRQDVAHSIKQTSDGGFIIAGTTHSSDGDVTTNLGQTDAWIVKLGVCTLNTPDIPGIITGTRAPCAGTPISFSIEAVNEATGYTWTFPEGWSIISGQGTTAITVLPDNNPGKVSVVAYNGCKRSGENTITVIPINVVAPQITIVSDAGNNICQGVEVVFTADVAGAITPIYQWKKNGINAGTNATIYRDNTLENGDIVSCELTSITNCGSQSVVVSPGITMSVSPVVIPTISISGNTTSICNGSEVQFTATATDGGANPIYSWYLNNTSAGTNLPTFSSHSLSDGDVISCQLMSSETCTVSSTAESNQITISVDANTEAFANITSTATTICKNDKVTFDAEVVNAGTSPTYNWSINGVPAGSNTPVFIAGNLSDKDQVAYTVTPGLNTCAVNVALSNKIQITINPLPQIMIYPSDTLVKPGTQVQFHTFLSENIRSFIWSPGGMLLIPSLLEPTTVPIVAPVTYRLAITTEDGCPVYRDVTIKPLISLFMPNAFTPNGDRLNDLFRIPPGTDLSLTEFSVYNIWGEKIFLTTDIISGWDGRIKGVDQSSGVYIYIINGFQNDKRVFLKGTFTLIR